MTLITPKRPAQLALLLMALALMATGTEPPRPVRGGPIAADFEAIAGMVVPLVDGPYEDETDEEEEEILEANGQEGAGRTMA